MPGQFTVAGHRLEYEIIGVGEPVLFVSNIAMSTIDMRAFAPMFDAVGCQLILVDHDISADTTVEAVAAHLGLLLDHLGVSPWLWGYSQGACVAQELALARPERVRGAVLFATRGRLSRFLEHYLLANAELHDASDNVATCLTLLALMSPELLGDDDQMEFALRRPSATRHGQHAERTARSLRTSLTYDNRLAALGDVRVPCLVVSFGNDMVCPPRLGREVADAIPHCHYTEIPGAGHNGLITHATDVLDSVTGFIRRQRAAFDQRRG